MSSDNDLESSCWITYWKKSDKIFIKKFTNNGCSEKSWFLMALWMLMLAFDAQHCTQKCRTLFADSPKKLASCIETCSHDPTPRDKILYSQEIMRKDVVDCINECNKNVNSSTNFIVWSKCRKTCLVQPNSDELYYFDQNQCASHCDRYWKGTVHWKSCTNQCDGFTRAHKRNNRAHNNPPPGVFNIW